MKRHPALIPLSHDHHAVLVQARRLRLASGSDVDEARVAASTQYVEAFPETERHFRLEEEQLFPTLVRSGGGGALLAGAIVVHHEIRTVAATLGGEVAAGQASPETMVRLAELLDAHARGEERELFPLIQETVSADELSALDLSSSITAVSDEAE